MEYIKENKLIIAVFLFFVLLFVYTKLAGPIPFTVNNINTQNSSPFEVTGTGKASEAPDKAQVNLCVTNSASDVLTAQERTNQAIERVIDGLKNLDIPEEDIKTVSYQVNPEYDFSGGTQSVKGYSVSQNLEVKSPIDKANQVIDMATGAGANLIGNISFVLDDAREEELKNQARAEAVEKAKKSAEGLAKASGIKLGKIINVRENYSPDFPGPIALDTRETLGNPEGVETSITPGESNVEVTVTLTYQTL